MYLYDKVGLAYYDLDKHSISESYQDDWDNLWYVLVYYSHKSGRREFRFVDKYVEFVEKAPANKIK